MFQAIAKVVKPKEMELPCDKYGDHIATNAMIIVFFIATFTGGMFLLTGIDHFFKISILAQGGSYITFQIYKWKNRG